MALTNFDATTPVTATYLNGFVNKLPRTAVLARSSKESEATTIGTAFVELARLRLRPVQGNYLHLSFDQKGAFVSGGTARIRTVLEYLGGQLTPADHDTSSTSYSTVSRSINMASVSGNDLTCEDVDLVFFGKGVESTTTAYLRSIWVASSDQASAASSGQ